MKVSNLSGVQNSTDDSVIMLSYTTDGGATYETKKIRLADLIDDFQVGDLADVDGTILPSNGQALVWNAVTSMWNPGTVSGGGGGGIGDAPFDGGYYVRQNGQWVNEDEVLLYRYVINADGGSFETGESRGAFVTLDPGDFSTGVSNGIDQTVDGGIFT